MGSKKVVKRLWRRLLPRSVPFVLVALTCATWLTAAVYYEELKLDTLFASHQTLLDKNVVSKSSSKHAELVTPTNGTNRTELTSTTAVSTTSLVNRKLEELEKKLAEVTQKVSDLQKQNFDLNNKVLANEKTRLRMTEQEKEIIELKKLLTVTQANQNNPPQPNAPAGKPSLEYEQARRQLESDVNELWYFLRAQLPPLSIKNQDDLRNSTFGILNATLGYKRAMLANLRQLEASDGFGPWRRIEARNLSDIVERRLGYLQNPKDCVMATKDLLSLLNECGFTCQLHGVVRGLMHGYATGRTLLLDDSYWNYGHTKKSWGELFNNLSDTCSNANSYGGNTTNSSTASVQRLIPMGISKFPFHPLMVPEDLAARVAVVVADPSAWWVGQLARYLMRPNSKSELRLKEMEKAIGFVKPIVGIHIRRTDKVQFGEASFHSLKEYMEHADEWFMQLNLSSKTPVRPRIFIASDDFSVLNESKINFPNYEIISTMSLTNRSGQSIEDIVADVYFLSKSDFLVCTLSSGVGRLAYELMHQEHPDARFRVRSLDDVYYFGMEGAAIREVIWDHEAARPEEIDLKIGDDIGLAGNHWDGFSLGTNRRTGKKGLFPSYKVREKLTTGKFNASFYAQADKA